MSLRISELPSNLERQRLGLGSPDALAALPALTAPPALPAVPAAPAPVAAVAPTALPDVAPIEVPTELTLINTILLWPSFK